MISTKIFVDAIEVELGKEQKAIPITYQIIDIKNFSKRKGSTTKTVTVPRTVLNDKIFGVAFNINAENQFNKFKVHNVLIEENLVVIFEGFLQLTEVSESKINFFCFADISKIKSLFGEKTLNDLQLQDLDHLYNETIFDTWDGTYPVGVAEDYFYPLIDYGRFQLLTPTNRYETPDILITDLYPALYLRRCIFQMFLDSGYTIKTSFFDDETIAKILIPFSNESFVHSQIGGISINGFWGFNAAVQPLDAGVDGTFIVELNNEIEDPLAQWSVDNYDYTSAGNETIKYTFNFEVTFANSSVVLNPVSYLFFEHFDGVSWNVIRTETIEAPNQRTVFRQQYEGVLTMAINDSFRVRFQKNDEPAAITIRCTSLKIDPSAGGKLIEVGEFVQVAPNLPSIKQADVFRACFQMFNWIVSINDITSVATIETFDEFYLQGEQIDMSKKLNLIKEPSINYSGLDFGKKFLFKYKHDKSDFWLSRYDKKSVDFGNNLFGDGSLILDEAGEEVLVGEVVFSPSVIEKSFQGGAGSEFIDLLTMLADSAPTEKNTAHEARLLINGGLVTIDKLSAGNYTNLWCQNSGSRTEIPLCYFQKKIYNEASIDSFLMNLSFATPGGVGFLLGNLIDEYYKASIFSLSVSPQVTAYFDLISKDVSSIDFSAIWFVDYFGATFRLNKIVDYLPNSNSPTKVELIKVGVFNQNKNNYTNFE